MKDKTLSDKIVDLSGYTKGSVKSKYYWEKDVKDFIQKLKKDCCECHMHPIMMERDKSWKCWFCVILNKLAGDALIHSPGKIKALQTPPAQDTPDAVGGKTSRQSSGTHGSGNARCTNNQHTKQSEHSPSTNPAGYRSSVKEPSDKSVDALRGSDNQGCQNCSQDPIYKENKYLL